MVQHICRNLPAASQVLDEGVDISKRHDTLSQDQISSYLLQITVDGDTSTNDAVLGLASGAAGGKTIKHANSEEAQQLEAAVTALLQVGHASLIDRWRVSRFLLGGLSRACQPSLDPEKEPCCTQVHFGSPSQIQAGFAPLGPSSGPQRSWQGRFSRAPLLVPGRRYQGGQTLQNTGMGQIVDSL